MIKSLLLVVLGVVLGLEIDKRMGTVRAKLSPRAVTDAMLDKVNAQLEKGRSASS